MHAFAWNHQCVPVFEWNDYLYVAYCGETPDFNHAKNIILVKAEENQIKAVYDKITPAEAQNHKSSIQHASVDIMDLMQQTPEESNEENILNIEQQDSAELLDLNIGTTPSAADISASQSPAYEPLAFETKTAITPTTEDHPTVTNIQTPTRGNENIQSLIQEAFADLKNHFSKSMILLIKDSQAAPVYWDENFKSANNLQVSLDSPSPFRIAFKTQKPYHGYVVSNDTTEPFFEDWLQTNSPDHLTLCPIIIDEKVEALLMSVGEKASDNKLSLQFAESVANKLASNFKSIEKAA